ncbi:MAG TPA: XRE family transcriptional regulator, partial [Kiritimatiellia bacterium]|nr:XRE family transcriptional regulator [Kiritimatiellia bacterium]
MTRGSTKGRSIAKPGAALRNLRLAKGWTLGEVSQRTGMPLSTLSKVENDKMSLTYDKLVRISEGMEIDLAELFNPGSAQPAGPSSGRRSITRASEGREIETPNYEHLYPAADLLNKRLVPIIAEVRARSLQEFGQLIRHPGEEYAYVLEGAIELHTDLYAP